MSLFLFQDMFNLLSTIGQTVFWTQLGFGLFLFVCLMITTGLILWCRIKRRQLREQLEAPDPSQPSPPSLPDRPSQPDRPRQPEQPSLPDRPRPDLNAAWNNADSTSIYDDPRDLAISTNPFVGWDRLDQSLCSAQSFQMTQRPSRYPPNQDAIDALNTLERNALKAKGTRPKWAESNASLVTARSNVIRSATQSHLDQAGYYSGPSKPLPPPPPKRTSSLRWKKAKRAEHQPFLGSTDHIPTQFREAYEIY